MERGHPRSRKSRISARRYGTPTFAFQVLLVLGSLGAAQAQSPPPPPPPPAVTPAPGATPTPTPSAQPAASSTPVPATTNAPSATSAPGATPAPGATAAPATAPLVTPVPYETPTPPPIIVEPATGGVQPGDSEVLRVMQELGSLTVTVADPAIVSATVDETERTVTIVGKAIGATTLTVRDERGLTRDVPIRVAYTAGAIPESAFARITGRPATEAFVREQALAAALRSVSPRPGAVAIASQDSINVSSPLQVDDITTVDVPVILQGDAYFTVQGTVHVRIENFAQPMVRPKSLLVSDYPETLKENGTLFSADLSAKSADRFLYFHYNPGSQPDRRIVLKVQNPSNQPALVQFIAGQAGPDGNEMLVGHQATERFLVRLAQNEGSVVTVPPNTTLALAEQLLPARSVVSGLMQLHEIEGAQLHLALVAQSVDTDVAAPIGTEDLLQGGHPHARGIYPIPEFFFDYSYDAEGPDLEIPIGQIPLPNLVHGQTLAGDYGVLQSVTIRMINNDRHNARDIALYASPRGGRATGSFVIDRVLVQAHAMAPYGHYKLRQYTIPPGSFVRTDIVTIPEGGSSYPLRLIVAPDDGSAPPGSSDSPIY
jgi:hypothetical protein